MTRSPTQAARMNQRGRAGNKLWFRAYRSRMDEGYETCRNTGCGRLAMTFAHIVPAEQGGRFVSGNLTLLCQPCNVQQDTQVWPWLIPLTLEWDFLEVVYGGPEQRCGCVI